MNPSTLGTCLPEASAPQREPAMRSAIAHLADALSYAEDRLAQLEGRLAIVMSPAGPETRNEAIRKDSRCEMEDAIQFQALRVFEVRHRLEAILDRLEV